jgi:hypothetical protein
MKAARRSPCDLPREGGPGHTADDLKILEVHAEGLIAAHPA